MAKHTGRVVVEFSVDIDKSVDRLKDIIGGVAELSDLVPDWNKMEAEEIEQRIYNNLSDLIKSERKK